MARSGRFRGYPGRFHGNLTLLLGEEDGRVARRGAAKGSIVLSCWAELEKTAGKMVESSLELADRVESA